MNENTELMNSRVNEKDPSETVIESREQGKRAAEEVGD